MWFQKGLFVYFNLRFTTDSWWFWCFVLPLEGGLGTPQLNRFILAQDHFTIETNFKNLSPHYVLLLLLSLVGVFFLLSTYFLLTADPQPQKARSGRQFVTQPLYYGATLLPNPGLFAGVNPFNRGVVDMNAACLTPEKQLVYWFPFLHKMPCRYTLILRL